MNQNQNQKNAGKPEQSNQSEKNGNSDKSAGQPSPNKGESNKSQMGKNEQNQAAKK